MGRFCWEHYFIFSRFIQSNLSPVAKFTSSTLTFKTYLKNQKNVFRKPNLMKVQVTNVILTFITKLTCHR